MMVLNGLQRNIEFGVNMKKILQPEEKEEAIYYSDFSGKLFKDFVPVTVKVECDYGSVYDGASAEFHLSDTGLHALLHFLKSHLCSETKQEFERKILENNEHKDFYKKLI